VGLARIYLAAPVAALLVLGPVVLSGDPDPKRLAGARERPADNWPRWRGPNADGVAEGGTLPLRWSQTENVLWSVRLSPATS